MFAVKPQVHLFMQSSIRRSKMDKRVLLVIALLVSIALTVHFVYFQRPPTEDILNANRRKHTSTLRQKQLHVQEPSQKESLRQTPLQLPPQVENSPDQQNKLPDKVPHSLLQEEQQIVAARLQEKQQLLQSKQEKDNLIIKQVDIGQEVIDHHLEQTTSAKTATADVLKSVKEWEDFITLNEFVSIGDIYDKCGE